MTSARPGEKILEELFANGEVHQRTHHEKIFVCRNSTGEQGRQGEGANFDLDCEVDALIVAAERGDPDEVRRLLKVLVPEYQMADGRIEGQGRSRGEGETREKKV